MTASEIISMILGAGGSGISVGAVSFYLLRRYIDRRDKQLDELTADLKRKSQQDIDNIRAQIATINVAVTNIQLGCRADINHDTLQRIEGVILQIADKVDKTRLEVAALLKDIENKNGWIGKVEEIMQNHVQNFDMHHGRR